MKTEQMKKKWFSPTISVLNSKHTRGNDGEDPPEEEGWGGPGSN